MLIKRNAVLTGLYAIAEIGMPEGTKFAEMPRHQLTRLLVLDGVQDPGNLGTLLRTALALGWQGVFLLEGQYHFLPTERTCWLTLFLTHD